MLTNWVASMCDWLERESRLAGCTEPLQIRGHWEVVSPRWTMGGQGAAERRKHVAECSGMWRIWEKRNLGSEWQVGQGLYMCWSRNLEESASFIIASFGKWRRGASSSDQTRPQLRPGDWLGDRCKFGFQLGFSFLLFHQLDSLGQCTTWATVPTTTPRERTQRLKARKEFLQSHTRHLEQGHASFYGLRKPPLIFEEKTELHSWRLRTLGN